MADEPRVEMTVREAGRRGGMKRKQQLGQDGYSALGRMGGARRRELIEKGRMLEQVQMGLKTEK